LVYGNDQPLEGCKTCPIFEQALTVIIAEWTDFHKRKGEKVLFVIMEQIYKFQGLGIQVRFPDEHVKQTETLLLFIEQGT